MNIKKGDIILVHSHKFLGRLIQLGMNIERWRWFSFKPFWKRVYNHAAICIEDGIIAEALAGGITVLPFEEAYPDFKTREVAIYRPKLTKKQLEMLPNIAKQYEGVHYQFINFLQYIPKIFFGLWLGKTYKSAEDKLYCTEYVSLVLNKTTNGKLFPKYWRSSPSGVQSWCEKNCKLITILK